MMIFLIKFNLTLAIGFLLYKTIFQHGTTLTAKRYFLMTLILFAAATPLLSGLISSPEIVGYTSMLNTLTTINASSEANAINYFERFSPITIIYLLGVLIMILFALFKLIQLAILIAKSKITDEQEYKLVTHTSIQTPASFFNLIFMPLDLNANARELILCHEKLHAREWHSLDVLILELVKVLCWFNPFIYLIQRELRFVHECIADREAGQSEKVMYQELLVQFHLSASINNLTNHFNNSSNLKRRIIMFNATFTTNANFKKLVLVLPFFILIGILQSTAQSSTEPKVFQYTERMPEFPGGKTELFAYLVENIKYPDAAKAGGIEGTAYVEFIVTKRGKIESATIKKGASPDLDKEALRVVNAMPKWIPGEQGGKKVAVAYLLPIKFALN